MAKKNQKVDDVVEEVQPEEVDVIVPEPTPPPEPVQAKPATRQLTDAELNKAVRVQNAGTPFLCDLTAFGYGTRWPSKAVYIIPVRKYMELLEQGFNGSYV